MKLCVKPPQNGMISGINEVIQILSKKVMVGTFENLFQAKYV